MAKFKDKKGREWSLDLDVYLVEQIHTRTQFKIDKMIEEGPLGIKDVFGDVIKFGQLLWIMCEEQAVTRSVTPEDFARLFNGDVFEDAGEAFVESLADFSPRQQRTALKAVRQKMKELRAETIPILLEKIDRECQKALAETKAELASSTSVTTTPTSSASTPAVEG